MLSGELCSLMDSYCNGNMSLNPKSLSLDISLEFLNCDFFLFTDCDCPFWFFASVCRTSKSVKSWNDWLTHWLIDSLVTVESCMCEVRLAVDSGHMTPIENVWRVLPLTDSFFGSLLLLSINHLVALSVASYSVSILFFAGWVKTDVWVHMSWPLFVFTLPNSASNWDRLRQVVLRRLNVRLE